MFIITILITAFLEQQHLLDRARGFVLANLEQYIEYFTKQPHTNQRELRYTYLFATAPVFILLLIIKILLIRHYFVDAFLDLILFIISIQIFTWKTEAKDPNNNRNFISTYATRFFAPLFWFLLLPTFGPICYLIIILVSSNIKRRTDDLMIYNLVVDKMLFYANIIPYFALYLFIAIAGNFEEVTHYLIEKRKDFSKSFYFLENTLNEVILIAVGKSKFQIGSAHAQIGDIEVDLLDQERFTPQITEYIVAILYRAGLFFIGLLAIIDLTALLH